MTPGQAVGGERGGPAWNPGKPARTKCHLRDAVFVRWTGSPGHQATRPAAPQEGRVSPPLGQPLSRTYLGTPLLIQLHRHQSRRALLTHGRLPALPEEVDTLLLAGHPYRVLSLLSTSHCKHTEPERAG